MDYFLHRLARRYPGFKPELLNTESMTDKIPDGMALDKDGVVWNVNEFTIVGGDEQDGNPF